MFSKSYRLKTNTALKNSEKKQLAQRIQQEFPAVTEEQAKQLVPAKSTALCLRLTTHGGDAASVFAVDGAPIIVEAHGRLYPTMCALWRVPDMVPTITIHEPIVEKLKAGVPLYVPGVVVPAGGRGFPLFPIGAVVAVNSDSNRAHAAVGRALMSGADMLMKSSGVCMETVHVLGDFLCREPKLARAERPQLGPACYAPTASVAAPAVPATIASQLGQMSISTPRQREEWPSLGGYRVPVVPEVRPDWGRVEAQPEIHRLEQVDAKEPPESDEAIEETIGNGTLDDTGESDFPEDMDGLLRFCLLSFLKLEGKRTVLPLRLNSLYRNHMVPLCPPARTLDVKQSSYKKMGKFMEAMQKEGLVQVRLIEKGVDAVTGMDLAHPSVRAHYVPEAVLTQVEEARREPEDPDAYVAPVIREMYSVTANILDLFAPLRKGTLVTAADIRSTLTEYVRRHGLQSAEQPGQVLVDPVLAKIAGKEGLVSWEELNTAVQGKMTACTEMRFADGTVRTNKSRLEPVRMNVATRSGNKKVTLVSNLEALGFSLPALGKACQHGLSVSTTVTRTAGSKHDQLMVQGDQTYFITKLLIEKYHIPKKFIEGADKMLKKKK